MLTQTKIERIHAATIHVLEQTGVEVLLPEATDRFDFSAMLQNTTKPLMFSNWSVQGLADCYEMALLFRQNDPDAFRLKPSLMDRNGYENWLAGGAKDLATRLQERVQDILRDHRPQSIDRQTLAGIQKILERAKTNYPSDDR